MDPLFLERENGLFGRLLRVVANRRSPWRPRRLVTEFNEVAEWNEEFSVAAARAAGVATLNLAEVEEMQRQWRQSLRDHTYPRADVAAWAVINELPGVPVVTIKVVAVATRRARSQVTKAILQLEGAGVLTPLSKGSRSRTWEATGLLTLLDSLQI